MNAEIEMPMPFVIPMPEPVVYYIHSLLILEKMPPGLKHSLQIRTGRHAAMIILFNRSLIYRHIYCICHNDVHSLLCISWQEFTLHFCCRWMLGNLIMK